MPAGAVPNSRLINNELARILDEIDYGVTDEELTLSDFDYRIPDYQFSETIEITQEDLRGIINKYRRTINLKPADDEEEPLISKSGFVDFDQDFNTDFTTQ